MILSWKFWSVIFWIIELPFGSLKFLYFLTLILSTIFYFKTKIPNFENLREWWDHRKIEVCNICIKFCSCNCKSANRERISHTKTLIRAKNILHVKQSGDVSVVKNLECQLSNLISKEDEGGKIRSSMQWFVLRGILFLVLWMKAVLKKLHNRTWRIF